MANCIPLALYLISVCGFEERYFKSIATFFAVLVVALDCSEEILLSAGKIVLSMEMA